MQKTFTRLFYIGFAALWGWILINSVLRWPHNGLAALGLGLVFTLIFWALARWVAPLANQLTSRGFSLCFGAVFVLYAAFLAWMGWLLAEVPIMDMEVVLKTLPDLLASGRFGVWNGYYIVCNNNLGLALLLGGWYWLAGLFGFAPGADLAGVAPGIALNVLALLLSVWLCCRIARHIFGTHRAVVVTFLLCAGFAPFVLYAPCFYSDSLSMPFALLAVLCWCRYRTAKAPAARLGLLIGMGAAVFAGYAVKGSVAVVLIALLIQLFLEKKAKQALCGALALLLSFGILLSSYQLWQKNVFLDQTEYEALGLPLNLWFCYGSHGEGNYSQADFDAAMTVDTVAEREALIAQRIRENYAAMSPGQLAGFMTKKAAITWGDGLYTAEEFLATPQRANWTHTFIIKGQPGYMPMVYYCQAYLYMVQLLVLAAAVVGARLAKPGPECLNALCITGLVLFLSLWETKARYAFNFTPLLLLLAAGGLLALSHLPHTRKR